MDSAAAGARPSSEGDPTGKSAALAFTHSTSSWQVYVKEIYDPTLDDIQDVSEPEICRILGERSESSVQLRDESSKRFAVRSHLPQLASPVWPGGGAAACNLRGVRTHLTPAARWSPQDVSATVPRKDDCGSFMPILSLQSLGPASEDDELDEEGEEGVDDDDHVRTQDEAENGGVEMAAEHDLPAASVPERTAQRADSDVGTTPAAHGLPPGLSPRVEARRKFSHAGPPGALGGVCARAGAPDAWSMAAGPGAARQSAIAHSPREARVRSQLASLFREGNDDLCASLFGESEPAPLSGTAVMNFDLAQRLGMLEMESWDETSLDYGQPLPAAVAPDWGAHPSQPQSVPAPSAQPGASSGTTPSGERPTHRRTNSDPPTGVHGYNLWGAAAPSTGVAQCSSVWGPEMPSPSKSWGGYMPMGGAAGGASAIPAVSASMPEVALQSAIPSGACKPSAAIMPTTASMALAPANGHPPARPPSGGAAIRPASGGLPGVPYGMIGAQYTTPANSFRSSGGDSGSSTRPSSAGLPQRTSPSGFAALACSPAGAPLPVLPLGGMSQLPSMHMHQLAPPHPHPPFQPAQPPLPPGHLMRGAPNGFAQFSQPPLPPPTHHHHLQVMPLAPPPPPPHAPPPLHVPPSHKPRSAMEYVMATRGAWPARPAGRPLGDALRQVPPPAPGLCEPGPSRGPFAPAPADAAREFRQSKELAMSPRTRGMYKDFSHALRSKETQSRGIRFAKELAARCMAEMPKAVHWRVHLEMADLAKREKDFADARRLYRMATEQQPTAPQAWLEFAKMEEERGHFGRCQRILTLGLQHCPYHEALMLKGIKHLERMGELPTARSLLSQLRLVPINQSWRTVLEGALLEARAGETHMARRVFKFLLSSAPWYGPVWYEACRFEQRCNHLHEALRVAEEGLRQLPRYGPLWFCALRLLECVTPRGEVMAATRAHVERGVRHISKDLVWKLWFESAQVEERSGQLLRSRAAYVKSVAACAPNLRWKVWLGGARTELSHSRFDVSQALLERALEESPPKTRAIVMLEQSRLHELRGDVEAARRLLRAARQSSRSEWKVFLESLLLEVRAECTDRALREARRALEVHRGTGRLWAVLIQLEQPAGIHTQLRVFQQALLEVPKSGEVWCEGARICLNPFSACFNLEAAHSFLDFAIEFTPQYGDSFIEYLRMQVPNPSPSSPLRCTSGPTKSTRAPHARRVVACGDHRLPRSVHPALFGAQPSPCTHPPPLQMLIGAPESEMERLWQLCVNAEPNYGTLWFHCKSTVLLTTRQVLEAATAMLEREMREWKHVYRAAVARAARPDLSSAAIAAVSAAMCTDGAAEHGVPPPTAPPLQLPAGTPPADAADFVTGCVALNRMNRQIQRLSFDERRALIYGGDLIVP